MPPCELIQNWAILEVGSGNHLPSIKSTLPISSNTSDLFLGLVDFVVGCVLDISVPSNVLPSK